MRCVASFLLVTASGVAFANRPVRHRSRNWHAEGALRACDVASVLLGRATASQRRPRGVRCGSGAWPSARKKAIPDKKGNVRPTSPFHRIASYLPRKLGRDCVALDVRKHAQIAMLRTNDDEGQSSTGIRIYRSRISRRRQVLGHRQRCGAPGSYGRWPRKGAGSVFWAERGRCASTLAVAKHLPSGENATPVNSNSRARCPHVLVRSMAICACFRTSQSDTVPSEFPRGK